MKNVKKPIRIPQDLRDTVTALHIDPTEMMQRFIDKFRFYPHFSTLTEKEKKATLSRIRNGLKEFQLNADFDPIFEEVYEHYGKLLLSLSNQKNSFLNVDDHQSIALITDWEKELRPLINYPQQIMLEGGELLHLSFDFMLCNIDSGRDIRSCLESYMKRISIVNLYACMYPGNSSSNSMMIHFFENLWDEEGDVFLPRTDAQTTIIEEYGGKFGVLFNSLAKMKNYRKRLQIFRPLVKEWATKMEEIKTERL